MHLFEYMSLLSTYIPAELGSMELKILSCFVKNEHLSSYDVFKENLDPSGKFFIDNTMYFYVVDMLVVHKPEIVNKGQDRASNLDSKLEPHPVLYKKPISYKNIHKRIKRLERLNLIQSLNKIFDRGAKHYKITPYGLTAFFAQSRTEVRMHIQSNKDNIVIKALILQYFEERTIDSFSSLKDDNTGAVSDYLSDCCSLIKKRCSNIWKEVEKYNIKDILPNDQIIQKYMVYLDERGAIEPYILEEIEQYKSRLTDWILSNWKQITAKHQEYPILEKNRYLIWKYGHSLKAIEEAKKDPTNITEEPPFPFNYIYTELDLLDELLHEKIRALAISLVNMIGFSMQEYDRGQYKEEEETENIEGKRPTAIDLILDGFGRDNSMRRMMEDKKLLELIKDIKKMFDLGFTEFINFDK